MNGLLACDDYDILVCMFIDSNQKLVLSNRLIDEMKRVSYCVCGVDILLENKKYSDSTFSDLDNIIKFLTTELEGVKCVHFLRSVFFILLESGNLITISRDIISLSANISAYGMITQNTNIQNIYKYTYNKDYAITFLLRTGELYTYRFFGSIQLLGVFSGVDSIKISGRYYAITFDDLRVEIYCMVCDNVMEADCKFVLNDEYTSFLNNARFIDLYASDNFIIYTVLDSNEHNNFLIISNIDIEPIISNNLYKSYCLLHEIYVHVIIITSSASIQDISMCYLDKLDFEHELNILKMDVIKKSTPTNWNYNNSPKLFSMLTIKDIINNYNIIVLNLDNSLEVFNDDLEKILNVFPLDACTLYQPSQESYI